MQADSIKIECEDDGFHLVIDGDDPTGEYQAAEFNFNIHGCAEALHEQVNLIIGGWLAEGQAAARMPASAVFRCAPEDIDESGGVAENSYDRSEAYDQADPKHKDWHSIHADLYDNREKV